MENIIDKIVFRKALAFAKALDEDLMQTLNAPDWIAKRLWLFKIYARMRRVEIRQYEGRPGFFEFWVRGRKVFEKQYY